MDRCMNTYVCVLNYPKMAVRQFLDHMFYTGMNFVNRYTVPLRKKNSLQIKQLDRKKASNNSFRIFILFVCFPYNFVYVCAYIYMYMCVCQFIFA